MIWYVAAAIFLCQRIASGARDRHDAGVRCFPAKRVVRNRSRHRCRVAGRKAGSVERRASPIASVCRKPAGAYVPQLCRSCCRSMKRSFARRMVAAFDGTAVRTGNRLLRFRRNDRDIVAGRRDQAERRGSARRTPIRVDLLVDVRDVFADGREAGETQTTEWLEGGQPSTPVSLAMVKPARQSSRDRRSIPGARLHAYRSERSRSHAVRVGDLSAQPPGSPGSGARSAPSRSRTPSRWL